MYTMLESDVCMSSLRGVERPSVADMKSAVKPGQRKTVSAKHLIFPRAPEEAPPEAGKAVPFVKWAGGKRGSNTANLTLLILHLEISSIVTRHTIL